MSPEDQALEILLEWCAFREKRRFMIGYGFGYCEALVITLFDDAKLVGFAAVEKEGLLSAVRTAITQCYFGEEKA